MRRLIHQIKDNLNIKWIFIAIIFLSILGFYANYFPPITMWHIIIFLILLALATYSLSQFILNNVRRSVLLSLGVIIFFILQLMNLKHPIYLFLLVAVIVSLNSILK